MPQIPTRLAPGVALVLCGPQGCGKNTVARTIAAAHGRYTEASDLEVLGELPAVLRNEPRTVVVDCEGQITRQELARLAVLVSSPTTRIRAPFQAAEREVPTPHFIFCTGDAQPFQGNRRFHIVRLHAGGRTQH